MTLGNLPWYYWVIALALLAIAWWLKRKADDLGSSRSRPGDEGSSARERPSPAGQVSIASPSAEESATELIAVIAAAVAAASGLQPSQFRIANISPAGAGLASGAMGPASGSGWNSPVWGRVERFARPAHHR
ncbi:MAG: hypothetical protein M0001_07910 [Treponema sp.]|nr:hypothetical protein [Treponema sp.]